MTLNILMKKAHSFSSLCAKETVVEKETFCGPSPISKYVVTGPYEGQKLHMMGWSFQLRFA